MKNSIKLLALLIVGGTHCAFADYVTYTKLYIGFPYSPQIPVASFSSSLPDPTPPDPQQNPKGMLTDSNPTSTDDNLSISGPMDAMFQNQYGNIMVNGIIESLPTTGDENGCIALSKNSVLCNYNVSRYGKTVTWPVWFYNGLRAKTIEELISARTGGDTYQIDTSKPYYYEISATPADFTSATEDKSVTIVDLNNYFVSNQTDPGIVYTLDAKSMLGNTPGMMDNNKKICATPKILGLKSVSCADGSFSISNNNLTAVKSLSSGIYQINVVATQQVSDSVKETDYQTFYINVNDKNPSLNEWMTGQVASTNVIGQYPSVYVYSSKDPDKAGEWDADYKLYAQDLKKINTYLASSPIKTVFFEMINVMYPGKNQKTWPVDAPNPFDVSSQINPTQITTNRESTNWIATLIADFKEGPGITMSYTFDNMVKAAMVGFNDKQQQYVAELMVKPIIENSLDGVSMDLEGGFNQPAATALFKKINDRLAYHGKWFSFYYFSDIFGPSMIAAFGPLGVANISTYDVGQYRAPKNFSQQNMLPGSIAYAKQTDKSPWTSALLDKLFDNFSKDGSCNTSKNDLYSPVSYCNLTTNDSVSENTRRYTNTYHTISTQDAMTYFNGKYQLAFPLAASATEWEAIEIWNPDLDLLSNKSGILSLNKTACADLNNQWMNANEANLKQNTSEEYKKLSSCLMMDSQFNIGDVSYQTWSKCGDLPLSQCLKVSNLPSSTNNGVIGHPSVLDYVQQNMLVYCQTNASHYVGYSVFALENAGTAAQGAFGAVSASVDDSGNCLGCNLVVQEPWYLGYQTQALPDPYYSEEKSDAVWKGFANIVNNFSTCDAPPAPSQECLASNFNIECNGNKTTTISYQIDSSAYANGVCLGYCSTDGLVVTDTGQNDNQNSIDVAIGSGIYINSDASKCYDNNGKNGGDNIGAGTTGIYVTKQNNQPKCTIQGENPPPKS